MATAKFKISDLTDNITSAQWWIDLILITTIF